MFIVEPTYTLYKNDDFYSHKYLRKTPSFPFRVEPIPNDDERLPFNIYFVQKLILLKQLLLLCSRLQLHIIVIITKLLQVTS